MITFDDYFEWLMRWEGETFEDDPDDPGGRTKYGIDQRSHPNVDIRDLTREEAKNIYRRDYWDAVKADELPPGLRLVVVDIAVNNGRSRAIKWLQQAAGADADGIIGPKTLAAVQRGNKHLLTNTLIERRANFYRDIARGRMAKYLRGWLNRNRDLERFINTN